MSDSVFKRFKTGLALLYLMLNLLVVAGILTQTKHLNDLKSVAQLHQIERMLPLVQEKVRPLANAETIIRESLNGLNTVDQKIADDLNEKFKQNFGESYLLFVADREGRVLMKHGLSLAKQAEFRDFIRNWEEDRRLNSRQVDEHNEALVKNYFERTITQEILVNYLNITESQYLGDIGVFVAGLMVKRDLAKTIRKRYAMGLNRSEAGKETFGAIIAFVPLAAFNTSEFVKGNFFNGSQKFSSLQFGSVKKIATGLSSDPALAEKFIAMTAEKHQFVFQHQNRFYGFARAELPPLDEEEPQQFFLFTIDAEQELFSIGNLSIIFLLAANFALFLMLVRNRVSQFQLKMKLQFAGLAFVSILIPFTGLLYQNTMASELAQNAAERRIAAELEGKVKAIENTFTLKKNDLVNLLHLTNERIDPHKPINYDNLQPYLKKINLEHVVQIYSAESDGSMVNFNLAENWDSQDTRIGTSMVQELLRMVAKNMKLGFAENNPMQKRVNRDGMIMEAFMEAAGDETLYRLVIDNLKLIPFKIIQGSVWSFKELQKDSQGKNSRLLMYVVNRNEFTHDLIDKFQLDQKQSSPSLFFLSTSLLQIERIAPTILETNPQLLELLKTVNRAGGTLTCEVSFAGKTHLALARRMKDVGWSCLALSPELDRISAHDRAFWFTAAVFICLMFLILFLAGWLDDFFLSPVLQLNESTAAITRGDYEISARYKANDEIGYLSTNFAVMAQELKEKEYLARFLSDIAKDAIAGEKTTRARKIEATVLFSDIRGFTGLSEKYPPEQIGVMLNDYFTGMEETIELHGGSIEKFIGDAVMAIFLPRMGMSHTAVRATQAARAMMTTLAEFNADRRASGLFTVSCGVGIASGELLMGTMGNLKGRQDFTVTGKTVNIAAVMEKHSKNAGKTPIVLCPQTAKIVQEHGMLCLKMPGNEESKAYELSIDR